MQNSYLAVQIKGYRNAITGGSRENPEPNIGYYAYVLTTNENLNLVSELKAIKGLVSVNVCSTKKRARELVEFWNQCFKGNGTYLFDEPKC